VKGKQHGLGTYFVVKDNKARSGLWEDGKRIEWYNDDEVNLIMQKKLDYTQ